MGKENVFQDGPYVNSAFICEKLLEERDGVKTAVRIIDRVNRSISGPSAPEEMPRFTWSGFLLLRLKAGKATGKHKIVVRMQDPKGQEGPEFIQSILLEGGPDRGIDFVMNLALSLDHEGVYWLNFYFEEFLLTRTPLRVTYVIQRAGTIAPPGLIQ
jgi:hypothetical protein